MSVTCPKCNKSFSSKGYLTRHLNQTTACNQPINCKKCGKEFESQGLLNKHYSRKTPCVDEEPEEKIISKCEYCDGIFSSVSNLNKHMRTVCKVRKRETKLEKEMAELKNMIKTLVENQASSVTINNMINTVQQNMYVNVTICNFGSEDLSKLNQQDVINLLKGQVDDFMIRMIEYIYANPEYPERHNIFYDPVRRKVLFQCRVDDKIIWKFDDIENISKLLTDKIKDYIHPLNSPYFNTLAGAKDIETANKIPQILCTNWGTPKTVEGVRESLTKVTKNEGFMDQVKIHEIE